MASITGLILTLWFVLHQGYCKNGYTRAIDLRNFGVNVAIRTHNISANPVIQTLFGSDISFSDIKDDLLSGLANLAPSDNCYVDVGYVLTTAFTNLYSPQFKYIDAAAKIPQGIMQGKLNWVGDFHECHSIPEIVNPLTQQSFQGNYFTGFLTLAGYGILENQPILVGLCLPDSCNGTTATYFLNYELSVLKANYSFIPKDLTIGVVEDKPKSLSSGPIGLIVVSGILVAWVVVGTMFDVLQSHLISVKKPVSMEGKLYDESHSDRAGLLANDVFSDGLIQQPPMSKLKDMMFDIVMAFSFLRNSSKLFNTDTAIGPLACLNGLRVLSMWWVILGHTYVFCIYYLDNILELADIVKRFSFQAILNGTFSVDSFFFLSGLLVAYLAIKEFNEKNYFNWIYYFLHRYWRLTPLYAYTIFFFAYLFVYLITGPTRTTLLPGLQEGFDTCKKYWWSNLIYINNFYPEYGSLAKTCLGWSWYLANDMQFFWFVSPPILVLFMYVKRHLPGSKNKLPGIAMALLIIVTCVVARGALVYHYGLYGLQAAPTKHTEDPLAKNGTLYARPWARMSVYAVGMLTGVVLAENKNKIRIPKLLALIGWCVCISTALAVVYGQYYYNHRSNILDPTHNPHMTMTQSIFYVSLSRTLWGSCLSWVVIACVSGNGGWVTQILSWKIWAPLGRLTYAAYLIHPMVLFGYYFNLPLPLHFSDWQMVNIFLSNLVITYALSFVVSMCLEAPMLQIEKAIMKVIRGQPRI